MLADHLETDQRLADVVVRLGEDEVDSFLGRPADLLAVHLAHDLARALGSVGVVDPRVADVPGDEGVVTGDLLRQPHRVAVERLEIGLAPDHPQLLAMPVVRERHHHVRSRAQKFAVELTDGVGEVEHDLGDVGAALQIATALQLEQVALGSEHDLAHRQTFAQSSHRAPADDGTPMALFTAGITTSAISSSDRRAMAGSTQSNPQ